MNVFALLGFRSSCLRPTPLCVGGDVSRPCVCVRVCVQMVDGVNKLLYTVCHTCVCVSQLAPDASCCCCDEPFANVFVNVRHLII